MKELFEGIEITENAKTELQKRFEESLKNADAKARDGANKILDTVAVTLEDKYGVPRNANETKIIDYIKRVSETVALQSLKKSESVISEKESLISELQKKIDAGVTDETTKQELSNMKVTISKLNTDLESEKRKVSEIESDYNQKINSFKIENSINANMPTFDSKANKYEIVARKNEAIEALKKDFNLKINDSGELIAEHKTNYTNIKISDYLNEKLKDLLPKTNEGGAGNPPTKQNGVSLVLTKDMSDSEHVELIHSYMIANGLVKSKADANYGEIFKQIYIKALK